MDIADSERARERYEAVARRDPAAVLVTKAVLRRVIRKHARVAAFGHLPRTDSYVVPRSALAEICDAADLGGRAPGELPDPVILLARPEDGDEDDAVARLERALFRADVHRTLQTRTPQGAALRARIHRIGETEFDEIRFVLRHDERLLPPYDDARTYAELAATYLELSTFAPDLLEKTFPALSDRRAVRAALDADVDVAATIARVCPGGVAPNAGDAASDEDDAEIERDAARPVDGVARVSRLSAPRPAVYENDLALAVIDAARSARRGHVPLLGERATRFGGRVAAMLAHELGERMWTRAIEDLARAAVDRRSPARFNVEARLLFDLEKACVAFERETLAIDFVAFATSLGRVPAVRPLPAQRDVRALRHLRSAAAKALAVHVADPRRAEIARLLRDAVARAEANLRAELHPVLAATLASVGLRAANAPEDVASAKLIEELIDFVVERGYLTIGPLRDAVSRNRLKLVGVRGPLDIVRGDEVLRADRELARALDGVYRRGEIYLRALQRVSAIAFGTRVGRFLTRFLFLPAGGAFVILEGLQHVVGPICEHVVHVEEPRLFTRASWLLLSLLLFGLLHSAGVRRAMLAVTRAIAFLFRAIVLDAPRFVWRSPIVRAVVEGRAGRTVGRYLLKPTALTVAILGALRIAGVRMPRDASAFVAVVGLVAMNVLVNTRFGSRLEEAVTDWLGKQWRELHRHVLPGLFALIANVFRALSEQFERAIYAVDAFLLFRRGDRAIFIALKGIAFTVWFFIAYLGRIYVNLLIEPQVNPLKHFPVVTVAAKIMLPMAPTLIGGMRHALTPLLGRGAARAVGTPTVFLLPGFFGFLVWELKENWKLYAANRPRALAPVAIGHHGETMAALLKIGLHSGTIPKTYAKLRRAAWRHERSALKHRHALHHVEDALRKFFERELVPLLEASGRLTKPLQIREIVVASNRVRVEVACDAMGETALLSFEEQSGWLLAGVARAGFIDGLDDDARTVVENALAGLYAMAAVDLVREQIAAALTGDAGDTGNAPPYDIADEGVVVWPGGTYDVEIVHRLDGKGELAIPMFRDQSITWDAWVRAWSPDAGVARLVSGPSLLPPRGSV